MIEKNLVLSALTRHPFFVQPPQRPISNPAFSTLVVPSLSSYHRLVVHRLADRFLPTSWHQPDIWAELRFLFLQYRKVLLVPCFNGRRRWHNEVCVVFWSLCCFLPRKGREGKGREGKCGSVFLFFFWARAVSCYVSVCLHLHYARRRRRSCCLA